VTIVSADARGVEVAASGAASCRIPAAAAMHPHFGASRIGE